MWEKGCYNRNRMQCKSSRFAYFLRRNCVNSFQELLQSIDWGSLTDALLRVLGVFLCLTVHETCHGLAALALGDPTAKREHRLSLNPLHHIDWFGLAAMLLVGFGWAKPVPVDMRYFKKPKQGMALTALAGPMSNVLLALVFLFLYGLLYRALYSVQFLLDMIWLTAYISLALAIFNIIPISPLDGSKVLFALLPDAAYAKLMRYERYGMILLLVLVATGVLGKPLTTVTEAVFDKLFVFAEWGYELIGIFG